MGNWIREQRGIYRLARFPQGDQIQLVLWHLWSQNRAGEPQGVYSHQTALGIYEFSDVMPAKLHLTVPPTFRRNAAIPKVLVLHRAGLKASDVEIRSSTGGMATSRSAWLLRLPPEALPPGPR
jgi:predicted transcriptional regulator of viral defense system